MAVLPVWCVRYGGWRRVSRAAGRRPPHRVLRQLLRGYFSTVKPCSVPYLTDASCQDFRPSASVVSET